MNSALSHPPTVPRWVSAISVALSLVGLAGLAFTLVLGFETPNMAPFTTFVALTFAAPAAALWHFAATRTLTAAEKRLWIREFTGADASSALSEYMTSPDLRASALRRSEDAAARRAARNRTSQT
jgi:hypothetical protein